MMRRIRVDTDRPRFRRFRSASRLGVTAVAFAAMLVPSGFARAEGSLAAVVQESVKGLGTLPEPIFVAAAPATCDVPCTRGDELAARVGVLLAGQLGKRASASNEVVSLATARARARRSRALVHVKVEIAKGSLRVTSDVYPVPTNGWERLRAPTPAPSAHAFASTPIDAEVRTYLPPVVLERAAVKKFRHEEGEVVAAACGDLDGDGGLELALVSRTKVSIGKLGEGKFVSFSQVPWSKLASVVPVPLREPLAGASIRGGALFVGTSDRGGVLLDERSSPVSRFRGIPLGGDSRGACLTVDPATSAFTPTLVDCLDDTKTLPFAGAVATPPKKSTADKTDPVVRYDAVARADVVDATGRARVVTATREAPSRVRLRVGDTEVRVLEGFGAELVVADLDQDGVPEVVTSSSDAKDDALSVASVTKDDYRVRMKLPAPGGVRALAACPPEENGVPSLVAVVGTEVWLVR